MDSCLPEPSGNTPAFLADLLPAEWLIEPKRPIEELLAWAYGVEQVDRMTKWEAATLGGRMRGGNYPTDSLLRLGRPFGGAGGGGFLPLPGGDFDAYRRPHQEARLLHDCVLAEGETGMRLIILHAALRTRPDHLAGWALRALPRLNKRGKIKKLFDDNRNAIGSLVQIAGVKPGTGQAIEWSNVAAARAVYAGWWRALDRVALRYSAMSRRLQAVNAALEAPWESASFSV